MARPRTSNCKRCDSLKVIMPNGASRCVPCHNRRGREYYHRSELRRANLQRARVRRRYGTPIDQLERILHEQGSCCAICLRPWSACASAKRTRYEKSFLQHLCVDHDHRRGNVRGLLCNACNTAIGLFEEDLTRFDNAAAYLRRHRA
jgi:hypothetical protein